MALTCRVLGEGWGRRNTVCSQTNADQEAASFGPLQWYSMDRTSDLRTVKVPPAPFSDSKLKWPSPLTRVTETLPGYPGAYTLYMSNGSSIYWFIGPMHTYACPTVCQTLSETY